MRVAFLGLGRMGSAMAGHVRDGGHQLTVWNRTPKPFEGAWVAPTVAEAVADADAVVLMLHGPDSVREVIDQVAASAPRGALVIDCTTVGPSASRAFAATLSDVGLRFVDAPVAGSVEPATAGTLGVFVGANDRDFADAEPLLRLWGDPERVKHVGHVGAGSALKLVVNQGTGIAAAALGEALGLAARLGIDRRQALDVLEIGAFGWTLRQTRDAVERGDFSQARFTLDLMAKDLGLVVEEGRADETSHLAVTRAARDSAHEALAAGWGHQDYGALIAYLAGSDRD